MIPTNMININLIPSSLLISLSGREVNILKKIFYIMQTHRKQSYGHTYQCQCSERWLAEQCHTTIWQISRSIQKLVRLGILKVRQRRSEGGEWLTNLYMLGKEFWNHCVRILTSRKRRKNNRLQESANISSFRETETQVSRQEVRDFIKELAKKTKNVEIRKKDMSYWYKKT